MTLDAYLNGKVGKTLTQLSLELGVSKSRLSQLRDKTDWPPDLALRVEKATSAAVNASDLSHVIARARIGQAA